MKTTDILNYLKANYVLNNNAVCVHISGSDNAMNE
jgi:hypothetical protein